MPTLRLATELARRSVCSANLHHTCVGINLWATDHNDQLPALPRPDVYGQPWHTYLAFDRAAGGGDRWLPGKLYHGDHIPHPAIFYCPSWEGRREIHWKTWTYDNYREDWINQRSHDAPIWKWATRPSGHDRQVFYFSENVRIRTNYNYAPYQNPDKDGGRYVHGYRYETLEEYPQTLALAVDDLTNTAAKHTAANIFAHVQEDVGGFNVLFASGSVEFCVGHDAMDVKQDMGWFNLGNSWARYTVVLATLIGTDAPPR
jgi:hypothetical protein